MSKPAQESSQGIVTKIQEGDKKAECELIDKYYKTLFFIVLKQTDDPCLTQDICQETFIIVLQKTRKGEIKNSQAVGSFIRSVGVNLIIEHKRKLKRQKTDLSDSFEHLSDMQSSNVLNQLERQKALTLVTQLLEELNNPRDVILLREYFVYGKSKKDICDQLQLSAEHFDKVLYRARQRFKQLLREKFNLDTGAVLTHLISVAFVCTLLTFYFSKHSHVEPEVRDLLLSYHVVLDGNPYHINTQRKTDAMGDWRNVG